MRGRRRGGGRVYIVWPRNLRLIAEDKSGEQGKGRRERVNGATDEEGKKKGEKKR